MRVARSAGVATSEPGIAESPESYLQEAPRNRPLIMAPYRGETYYGIPSIKHSHYRWRTAFAFFCNNVAGGSQIIATLMDLLGGERDRSLVRVGRYLALAGGSLSTAVLISALHTPQRWYNMLRMLKTTSPMSIGIWSISPFVGLSALTAAGQITEDNGHEKGGRQMARIFGIPAALLGGMVTTYMGTELEETNMPLWASAHPMMAPLYAAVGMSTSTAALSLAAEMTDASERAKTTLNRLALAFGALELALAGTLERRWRNLPEAKSFERSSYAPWLRIGFISAGILMPLVLRAFEGKREDGRSSSRSIAASIAELAGTLVFQLVMVYGGRESGCHARDYFEYTKPIKFVEGRDAHSLTRRMERMPTQPVQGRRNMMQSERPSKKRSFSSVIGLGLIAVGTAALVMSLRTKKGDGKR